MGALRFVNQRRDSHPLMVPRIRNHLANVLKVDEAARMDQGLAGRRLQAKEELLAKRESDGQVLRRRHPDHRRHLPRDSTDTGAIVRDRSRTPQTGMRIYDACTAIPAFADAEPRCPARLRRCLIELQPAIFNSELGPIYSTAHPLLLSISMYDKGCFHTFIWQGRALGNTILMATHHNSFLKLNLRFWLKITACSI
jgi:hypothetical protein